MDPDALLSDLLDDARGVLARDDQTGTEDAGHVDLARKVVDLHDWIDRGGFLPQAWRATAGGHFYGGSAAEVGGE
ncbi:HNH endonuclease [Mycobacterium phage LilMcDreamy]|uniref:Uncharacterized protein n=1 Tax=Mycobacterium phage LilMcDreamy TaxID=2652422 RepID=A0A5P8D6R3_9CAUD|nr:HNH endonuclease [Mycobacterium phage LilMcDreamy]QFP94706.1 hypothetical protein SEA_LILMCDREAMY_86 [Mycobacterium phage LilMcDreamy]